MNCPVCGSKTKVLDSRLKVETVSRTRECLECLTRFKTNENIVIDSLNQHLQNLIEKECKQAETELLNMFNILLEKTKEVIRHKKLNEIRSGEIEG